MERQVVLNNGLPHGSVLAMDLPTQSMNSSSLPSRIFRRTQSEEEAGSEITW